MPRRHDIDALRVLAFALLILYHVGMVYVADWGFHIKSQYQAEWLQYPMIFLNRWRMPLLFAISGIAIGLARPERAAGRFAGLRSWRLLLPLVFGMFIVVSVQAWCEGRANGRFSMGFFDFLLRYWQVRPWPPGSFTGAEHGITWNHLWYLAYLWVYTMGLLAVLPALRPLALRGQAATASMPRWTAAVLLILPAAWLAVCNLAIEPRFPRTHALVGDWTVHAESLPLFLLGYLVAANTRCWEHLRRLRWATLTVAILAISIELSLRWAGRHPPEGGFSPWTAQVPWHAIEGSARGVYTWTALLAIFGWSVALLDRPWRWLPYANEAIYPWYMLHQSLIVPLAFWLIPLELGPVVEPLLVLLGTVAGCWLLHELVIRRTGWLRPLFGVKLQPKVVDGSIVRSRQSPASD